jgi:uncharacterized membrane protein
LVAGAWSGQPIPRPPGRVALASAWVGLLGWLAAGSAMYPVLATWARWQDRFASDAGFTLNGQAFMRTAVHTESGTAFPLRPDLEAIGWLRANVAGTPVIAEAHMPEYHWGSRVSIHTGLPTIVGWRHHQTQQRAMLPADVVTRRVRDVGALYTTPDAAAALAIVDRYRVEYVYVGPLERILYPADGIAKFAADTRHWRPVYERGDVRIYQVAR